MTTSEVRKHYLNFFKEKGHSVLPSSSLIPENDPTTLFTGSGMQPLVPYLLGTKHPEGLRLVNSQRCFRAEDIEEIGDNRHTTFFEMLGNWSLGDYFKKEQLEWFFSFLTDVVGIDPERIFVTCFSGDPDNGIEKDNESAVIWKKLFESKGIIAKEVDLVTEARGGEEGMQGGRIFYYGSKKNWWSRAGIPQNMPAGEPGGPDSEVFFEFREIEHDKKFGTFCHPNCDCGRFMEIGNSVFMEYLKEKDGTFSRLKQRNVDFGGGLERITAASNGDHDIFRSVDTLNDIIQEVERRSGKKYGEEKYFKAFRVIADHLRASVFMIHAGVFPSNTDKGYVLRRLIRRMVRHGEILGLPKNSLADMAALVISLYGDEVSGLFERGEQIKDSIAREEAKFRITLARGLMEFERNVIAAGKKELTDSEAFYYYQSFGFPKELMSELAAEHGIGFDSAGFDLAFHKHQEVSRAGTVQKFTGGLADHSEHTTKLHTATHLLHASLRKILGNHIGQKGSNITKERLRFDFSHPEKITSEQLRQLEELVNEQIKLDLPVTKKEMSVAEAKQSGALGFFEEKYGDKVHVYSMGDFSKEICGGPHVERTGELGEFKILKEESVSAGVRRIKAVVKESK